MLAAFWLWVEREGWLLQNESTKTERTARLWKRLARPAVSLRGRDLSTAVVLRICEAQTPRKMSEVGWNGSIRFGLAAESRRHVKSPSTPGLKISRACGYGNALPGCRSAHR